jgi:hypothetical protein
MKRWAILLASCVMVPGDTISRDEMLGRVRVSRVAGIDESSFVFETLQKRSVVEMTRNKTIQVLQTTFQVGKGGDSIPKPDHMGFDDWLRMYDFQSHHHPAIAELTVIRGNALLRFRSPQGRVEKKVLAGKNPLMFKVRDKDYEAVSIVFSNPLSSGLSVYVRTRATLNAEEGAELLSQLSTLFPKLAVSLLVRNDEWFVFDPSYPYFNPFSESVNLPDARSYGSTLTCAFEGGTPKCEFH